MSEIKAGTCTVKTVGADAGMVRCKECRYGTLVRILGKPPKIRCRLLAPSWWLHDRNQLCTHGEKRV